MCSMKSHKRKWPATRLLAAAANVRSGKNVTAKAEPSTVTSVGATSAPIVAEVAAAATPDIVIQIYIDADGCPVKDQVFKVAARYKIKVFVVANQYQKIPSGPLIEMSVVSGGFDAADDWIVEQVTAQDIVVTSDILLADRCIKK